MMLTSRNRWVIIAAVAIVFVLVFGAGRYWGRHHAFPQAARLVSGHDFGAFYCAAKVAGAGHDPYRTEPLRTCEHSILPASAYFTPDVVEPAPLPSFALALLWPLTTLDFRIALALWTVVVLLCVAGSGLALSRLTGVPFWVALATLVISVAFLNVFWGQMAALCILLLSVAALLMSRDRPAAAGAIAALALIEPHLGLPACAALLLWAPRARGTLLAVGAALGVIGLLFVGMPTNVEYATRALPLHALAEAGAADQFSLTWLAFMAGLGDSIAVRLGSLSYAIALLVGIFLARRLSEKYSEPAFLVLVPPAVAVFGGVFVHDMQIAAAIPAALLLAYKEPRVASLAWVVVGVLAMSWLPVGGTIFAVEAVALAAIAWYAVGDIGWLRRGMCAIAAVCVYAGVMYVIQTVPDTPVRYASSPASFAQATTRDAALASAQWGIVMRTKEAYDRASLRSLAFKMPRWFALALLIGLSGYAINARRNAVARSEMSGGIPSVGFAKWSS